MSITVDFDDVPAPCYQGAEPTLTTEYSASAGILFDGSNARLDECSNFGVSGHSAPNFYAWYLMPESTTWTYEVAVDQVSFRAGTPDGGTAYAHAYDAAGALLGSTSVTMSSALQTVQLPYCGIARVTFIPPRFSKGVIDDITWETDADDCDDPVEDDTDGDDPIDTDVDVDDSDPEVDDPDTEVDEDGAEVEEGGLEGLAAGGGGCACGTGPASGSAAVLLLALLAPLRARRRR